MQVTRITAEECLDLRHRVLWPDLKREESRLEGDDVAEHFGIFYNNTLISCLSIFSVSNDSRQIRKFATDTLFQGQGYGSSLLQFVLDNQRYSGGKTVFLNARLSAVSFYQKFGFVTQGDIFSRNGLEYACMGITF